MLSDENVGVTELAQIKFRVVLNLKNVHHTTCLDLLGDVFISLPSEIFFRLRHHFACPLIQEHSLYYYCQIHEWLPKPKPNVLVSCDSGPSRHQDIHVLCLIMSIATSHLQD